MNAAKESYQVNLESFNGPLDLLLHLIRKSEINIYDIPIALITQQYLDYLNLMKTLNLSFAGEFLVMAATLIQIKSRMLLPKEEKPDDLEDDEEDPRSELVRRLVEYQQYKDAAGQLCEQERLWREIFSRTPDPQLQVPAKDILLDDVGLFDLLEVLQNVLTRTDSQAFVGLTPDTLTVQDRVNAILERLETEPTVTFISLFDNIATKSMVIVTFLGLLELVRMKLVRIFQGEVFGSIRITRSFQSEQDSDGAASQEPWNNGTLS